MSSKESFKVAIVGGSIAGLSLANMLEKVGIDYVLLEAYPEIAPQIGASIGLMPNGLRILDQLGCYERLKKYMDNKSIRTYLRVDDGSVLTTTEFPWDHLERRHGYPIVFIDRQTLLEHLYDNLRYKEKVFVNKPLANIRTAESRVELSTKDGEVFTADIVVGADGVHSAVRREMRRIADQVDPSYFASDLESKVSVTYKCLFGISNPVNGFPKASENFVLNRGFSHFIVPGPQGRIYWFVFANTGETVYGDKIPRYTKEDEAVFVKQHRNDPVTPTVTFGDLYAAGISSTLVPLEEHVYKRWHFQRMLTIGDAAHKQNPIGGQGGNGAIESAMALVNALVKSLDSHPAGLKNADIDDVFDSVEAVRRDRAEHLMNMAKETQQLHAQETLPLRLLTRILIPRAGPEVIFGMLAGAFTPAGKLDGLAVPKRLRVDPFDDELPAKPIKTWVPPLAAAVSLGCLGWLSWKSSGLLSYDRIGSRSFITNSGSQSQSVLGALYNMVPCFIIWTVESYRLGNQTSILALPSIFTIGSQLVGFSNVAPLYYLLSFFGSFPRASGRPLPITAAEAILPATIVTTAVSGVLGAFSSNALGVPKSYLPLLQAAPAAIPILTAILSSVTTLFKRKNLDPKGGESAALEAEMEMYKKKDIPALKLTYAIGFSVSAVLHIATGSSFTSILPWKANDMAFASVTAYNLLELLRLRQLGFITTGETIKAALGVVAGQASVGAGATALGLWYWRENVLSRLAT